MMVLRHAVLQRLLGCRFRGIGSSTIVDLSISSPRYHILFAPLLPAVIVDILDILGLDYTRTFGVPFGFPVFKSIGSGNRLVHVIVLALGSAALFKGWKTQLALVSMCEKAWKMCMPVVQPADYAPDLFSQQSELVGTGARTGYLSIKYLNQHGDRF
jgi:hypothetical protein